MISSVSAVESVNPATTNVKHDKSIKKTKDGGYIAEDDFKNPKGNYEVHNDSSVKQTKDGGYVVEDTFK
ncbi:hypothetical protein ACYATO_00265 [Lactobacillaceae bacterium Melli_B3]